MSTPNSQSTTWTPYNALPTYAENQAPQTPFEVLVSKIAVATNNQSLPVSVASLGVTRAVLDSFVEGQKAPTYPAATDGLDQAISGKKRDDLEPNNLIQKAEHVDSLPDSPILTPTSEPHLPKGLSTLPAASDSRIDVPDESDNDYQLLLRLLKNQIVSELFDSIAREDTDTITLLIQHNLVSVNTLDKNGCTPLLAAILTCSSTGKLELVKTLLSLGAEPNLFGVPPHKDKHPAIPRVDYMDPNNSPRTPLMYAAYLGSLPLVRLLFEAPYNADDGLVAPDGQIALRLASTAGHRHIVEYLPARRAGGWKRFQVHHAKSFALIREAIRGILWFIRAVVWYMPKFFVWDIPKYIVILPLWKAMKWAWERRGKFGSWCKRQVVEMPGRIVRGAKQLWNGVKAAPKVFWEFSTVTLPKFVKEILRFFWEMLTKRIPRAIWTFMKWIGSGITSFGHWAKNLLLSLASLIHTVLIAFLTLLRSVTLKDILIGLKDVLYSIFVILPTTFWRWIQNFCEVSYKIIGDLFGFVGQLLWIFVSVVVLYIPKRIWEIIVNSVKVIVKGCYEMYVWINPRA